MTTQKVDTEVTQTIINRLNQTQFNNASALEPNEVYAVDPQFTGGKVLVSTADGDIAEGTIDPTNIVTDVELNGTSTVTSGVASINAVTDVQQDGASIVTSGVATVPNAVTFRDWE